MIRAFARISSPGQFLSLFMTNALFTLKTMKWTVGSGFRRCAQVRALRLLRGGRERGGRIIKNRQWRATAAGVQAMPTERPTRRTGRTVSGSRQNHFLCLLGFVSFPNGLCGPCICWAAWGVGWLGAFRGVTEAVFWTMPAKRAWSGARCGGPWGRLGACLPSCRASGWAARRRWFGPMTAPQ